MNVPLAFTASELLEWAEVRILWRRITGALLKVITSPSHDLISRLHESIDKYAEACAKLKPDAAKIMREEMERELGNL